MLTACSGLNYSMIPFFFATDEKSFSWTVTADSIDWWNQRSEASCVATINASFMEDNVVKNDQMTLKEDVISWSPGVSNSFVASVTCLLVSIILFRLTRQNDNLIAWNLFGCAWLWICIPSLPIRLVGLRCPRSCSAGFGV